MCAIRKIILCNSIEISCANILHIYLTITHISLTFWGEILIAINLINYLQYFNAFLLFHFHHTHRLLLIPFFLFTQKNKFLSILLQIFRVCIKWKTFIRCYIAAQLSILVMCASKIWARILSRRVECVEDEEENVNFRANCKLNLKENNQKFINNRGSPPWLILN